MPPPTNRTLPIQPPTKRRSSAWLTLPLMLVFGIAAVLVAVNRQSIQDYLALRNYTAPTTVAAIATQDTMTSYARKVLYVNKPDIEDKAVFAQNCPNNGGEQTIVLGCYHSDQRGIFVLDVTDSRLNGVEQVTMAHEMLHAAYDRLSTAERNKVDAMLIDYFNHDLTDERIKATMAAYMKTEPHDVVNEMHSVFGTEIANLPSGLETYYKQYFTNRQVVTSFAAQYQAEFTSRQAVVTQDDQRLASYKTQIDSDEADLRQKLSTINAQQQTLQAERASGQTSSYNAGVPGYNALIDAYDAEVNSLQTIINQYNTLVGQRNAVALEEQQLQSDLSSTAQTITQ